MANPRHVFRPEGNAWLQQLEDQIVLGPSHVFEYIKTDGYKRLVDEERLASFFTIFMSIKQSILHDYDGSTRYRRGDTSGAPNDSFLQSTLKTLFRLSGVVLDL